MQKLREVEAFALWVSDQLLGKELLNSVWQELQLKKEWADIAARWSNAGTLRKSKNKKIRQKEKEASTAENSHDNVTAGSVTERLQQAVRDMDKRVWKCRTYHKYFKLCKRRGLLEYFDTRLADGSSFTLHGPGIRSITFVRPHGASKPDARPPAIARS